MNAGTLKQNLKQLSFKGTLFFIIVLFGIFLFQTGNVKGATPSLPSFASLVEKASPAVVNIRTVRTVKGGGPVFDFFMGPFKDHPFKDFFDDFLGHGQPREFKQRSLGSGFIIDREGHIITNNHVIDKADEVIVQLASGNEYKAKIVGRDPKTDIALIKIKASKDLPVLPLGDSDKLKVGDWVIAIGNPFGLDHTVTAGIISAKGRALGGPYDNFLQTDASINPGNSGGPLLNIKGEVIGINTAIHAAAQGIGFAIPINRAKEIVKQLKERGKVIRGWLGVLVQQITPDLAKSFGLKEPHGALVADVTPGGPAEKAGLRRGDIIVEFDGKEIKNMHQLPAIVAGTPVGKKVKVKVLRNGDEKVFEVKIGELKEKIEAAKEAPSLAKDLGLSVRELTPELASKFNIDADKGVVVVMVMRDSPAAEAGILPGDLILEINRKPINDLSDYKQAIRSIKKDRPALFLIKRRGATLYLTLKLGE